MFGWIFFFWLCSGHSHRFVWSPTVDGPHTNVLCLMPTSVQSSQSNMIFYRSTMYFTTTSRRKTGKENSKIQFFAINIPTDFVLRIHIDLFEVQQSIDNIQMSCVWCQHQCSPSILTWYFTIQQYILQPHPRWGHANCYTSLKNKRKVRYIGLGFGFGFSFLFR